MSMSKTCYLVRQQDRSGDQILGVYDEEEQVLKDMAKKVGDSDKPYTYCGNGYWENQEDESDRIVIIPLQMNVLENF